MKTKKTGNYFFFILFLIVIPFVIKDLAIYSYCDYNRPYYSFERHTRFIKNKEHTLLQAVEKFNVFLSYEIDDPNVYFQLGKLHWELYFISTEKKEHLQKAAQYFEKAAFLLPSWGITHYYLGCIYKIEGRTKLIDAQMEMAQILSPAHSHVIPGITAHWLRKWQKEPSVKYVNIIQKNLLYLNNINMKKFGNWSIHIWEVLKPQQNSWQEIIPNNNSIVMDAIPSLIKLKRFILVKDLLERIDTTELLFHKQLLLAHLALLQNDMQKCLQLMEAPINNLEEKHLPLLKNILFTMVNTGYINEAMKFLSKSKWDDMAFRMEMFHQAIACDSYNNVYIKLLPWFENTAQKFFQQDADLFSFLANGYESLERWETAIIYWEKCIAADPQNKKNAYRFIDFLFNHSMEYRIPFYSQKLSGYLNDPSEFYIFIAKKYLKQGDKVSALHWTKEALQLKPFDNDFLALQDKINKELKK